MGEPDTTLETRIRDDLFERNTPNPAGAGFYLATKGNKTEHIVGTLTQVIDISTRKSPAAIASAYYDGGERKIFTLNQEPFKWMYTMATSAGPRETLVSKTKSDSYSVGDKEDFFLGYQFSGFAGLKTSTSTSGNLDFTAGAIKAAISVASYSFTFSSGDEFKIGGGDATENVSGVKYINAMNGMKIMTGGATDQAAQAAKEQVIKNLTRATGGVVAAAAAVGAAMGGVKKGGGGGDPENVGTAAGIAISAAALAGLAGVIAESKAADTFAPNPSNSMLDMKTDKIHLSCGDASLLLEEDGTISLIGKKLRIKGQGLHCLLDNEFYFRGGAKSTISVPELAAPGKNVFGKVVSGELEAMQSRLGSAAASAAAAAETATAASQAAQAALAVAAVTALTKTLSMRPRLAK